MGPECHSFTPLPPHPRACVRPIVPPICVCACTCARAHMHAHMRAHMRAYRCVHFVTDRLLWGCIQVWDGHLRSRSDARPSCPPAARRTTCTSCALPYCSRRPAAVGCCFKRVCVCAWLHTLACVRAYARGAYAWGALSPVGCICVCVHVHLAAYVCVHAFGSLRVRACVRVKEWKHSASPPFIRGAGLRRLAPRPGGSLHPQISRADRAHRLASRPSN